MIIVEVKLPRYHPNMNRGHSNNTKLARGSAKYNMNMFCVIFNSDFNAAGNKNSCLRARVGFKRHFSLFHGSSKLYKTRSKNSKF